MSDYQLPTTGLTVSSATAQFKQQGSNEEAESELLRRLLLRAARDPKWPAWVMGKPMRRLAGPHMVEPKW